MSKALRLLSLVLLTLNIFAAVIPLSDDTNIPVLDAREATESGHAKPEVSPKEFSRHVGVQQLSNNSPHHGLSAKRLRQWRSHGGMGSPHRRPTLALPRTELLERRNLVFGRSPEAKKNPGKEALALPLAGAMQRRNLIARRASHKNGASHKKEPSHKKVPSHKHEPSHRKGPSHKKGYSHTTGPLHKHRPSHEKGPSPRKGQHYSFARPGKDAMANTAANVLERRDTKFEANQPLKRDSVALFEADSMKSEIKSRPQSRRPLALMNAGTLSRTGPPTRSQKGASGKHLQSTHHNGGKPAEHRTKTHAPSKLHHSVRKPGASRTAHGQHTKRDSITLERAQNLAKVKPAGGSTGGNLWRPGGGYIRRPRGLSKRDSVVNWSTQTLGSVNSNKQPVGKPAWRGPRRLAKRDSLFLHGVTALNSKAGSSSPASRPQQSYRPTQTGHFSKPHPRGLARRNIAEKRDSIFLESTNVLDGLASSKSAETPNYSSSRWSKSPTKRPSTHHHSHGTKKTGHFSKPHHHRLARRDSAEKRDSIALQGAGGLGGSSAGVPPSNMAQMPYYPSSSWSQPPTKRPSAHHHSHGAKKTEQHRPRPHRPNHQRQKLARRARQDQSKQHHSPPADHRHRPSHHAFPTPQKQPTVSYGPLGRWPSMPGRRKYSSPGTKSGDSNANSRATMLE